MSELANLGVSVTRASRGADQTDGAERNAGDLRSTEPVLESRHWSTGERSCCAYGVMPVTKRPNLELNRE